jgi:outer membrane protein assembly factor BamB
VEDGKVFFGSKDQNVYCVDGETGKLLWKFKTNDEVIAAPNIHKGKLFIGSFDKNLYCLDANTGRLIWKFATQGEILNITPILINDGVVYFSSFDNNIYAVEEQTGKLIWKFTTGTYGNSGNPVIHRGMLFHASRDGNLYALTLDGRLIWKFTNKEHLSTPVFFEDKIFTGSEDFNLYCISLQGKKLWSFKTESIVFQKPVVHDGKVLAPSWDCNLYAINIETHDLAWKFRAEGSPSYLPPPYESFEVVMKIPARDIEEEKKKQYDFGSREEEHNVSAYKSRITYQLSTHYREKGKYQVDSREEEF